MSLETARGGLAPAITPNRRRADCFQPQRSGGVGASTAAAGTIAATLEVSSHATQSNSTRADAMPRMKALGTQIG